MIDPITCGTITLGFWVTSSISQSPFTYEPAVNGYYSITYNLDGGTNAPSNPSVYAKNSPDITLAEPVRHHYDFIGWTWEGQDTPVKTATIPTGSTGDKTFTAHWEYNNTVVTLNWTSGAFTLLDGETLTGTGGGETHVTIADGATVTLSGVDITDITNDNKHQWPAITCLGNATIILADGTDNSLRGCYCTGIFVPVGSTLTVCGTGSLKALGVDTGIGSDRSADCGNIRIEGGNITAEGGSNCAGIGSGKKSTCGDITITGGTVNATGGSSGAGIGSGYESTCGNITITGGTVIATGGNNATGIGCGAYGINCGDIVISGGTVTTKSSDYAASIGCGLNGSCGNITITGDITKVTIVKHKDAPNYIGAGKGGTCGAVSIAKELIDVSSGNTRTLWGLALADDGENTELIGVKDGKTTDVLLRDRTLYKDGKWNTIVLPFDVTIAGSPLDGATAKPLTDATMTGAQVSLTFGDAVTTLQAGQPYIIRWDKADDYVDDDAHNIVNPIFKGVTVNAASNNTWNADHSVGFVGSYDAIKGTWADGSLLLGSNNTLHFAAADETLGALRAFVQVDNTKVESMPTAYTIDFGNGETATGSLNVVPGDANGDGQVTIADAVAIVNYLLGNASADFNSELADMNHDGHITITDAVALVNLIVKQ